MKLDNNDDYYRITGQLIIIAFIFFCLLSISVLYDVFHKLIPIPSWIFPVFFGLLFLIYIFIRQNKKFNFIIYDDEEEDNFILIKYYPMLSFNPKHQMLKIPKNALYKIEIQKAFFNLREEIIIYQTIKKEVAKYKPIPITALNKNEKKILIQTLNQFAKVKMNEPIV